MAHQVVKLTAATQRELLALGRAEGRHPGRSEPIELRPEKGTTAPSDDTLLLLVVGPHGVLASQRDLHGRPVDFRELRRWLAGAEAAVENLASYRPAAEAPPLSAHEADLLEKAGFGDVDAGSSHAPGALERSRMAFEILLKDSFSLAQAAKDLGVTTGRLRQRLAPSVRTLYGFKEQGDWRIPRFQFQTRGKLVRGIDKVIPHLSPQAHPLAACTWFVTPHQDLVVGESEERVSPVDWLAAGQSPEEVAALAEEV